VLLFSVASFVVILVGLSRIALGAHYLTDVMAGVFFGMTWLTLCRFVVRPWRRSALPPVIVNVLPEAEPALVPVPVVTEAESSAAPAANSLV
jgi:undecaprenyl-diphosphatase